MSDRPTPAESSPHPSPLMPSPPSRSVPPPVATTAILHGKAWIFGDNIDPDFPTKISKGDFIVAGKNFGGGSSREQAPVALKYAGISIVIAESFARIFYRNAFTIGLPALEISEIKGKVVQGDDLKVDIGNFTVENIRTKGIFHARKVPEFMQQMLLEGGLVEYYRRNKRFPWM